MDDIATIEQMQGAQAAPEPGQAKEKIAETTDTAVKVGIGDVKSAGYVFIYHTKTFERSLCNRNMLPRKLDEKLEDGSKAWTVYKPGEPSRGTVKCLLHPESPGREHFDTLGFPTCRKSNLTSLFQQGQHMRRRHPTEWQTIEEEKKNAKEKEEREYQRSVIEMVAKRSNDGSGQNQEPDTGGNSPSRPVKRNPKRARRTQRKTVRAEQGTVPA